MSNPVVSVVILCDRCLICTRADGSMWAVSISDDLTPSKWQRVAHVPNPVT